LVQGLLSLQLALVVHVPGPHTQVSLMIVAPPTLYAAPPQRFWLQ
jgi:hypothetical protein